MEEEGKEEKEDEGGREGEEEVVVLHLSLSLLPDNHAEPRRTKKQRKSRKKIPPDFATILYF